MGNKIQLFGELESVAVDKKLVDAVQVKDSAWIDPAEIILASAEEREPQVTEKSQSEINEILRDEALYAQSQLKNLSIDYNSTTKELYLLLEGEKITDGIDASDFTKDGMIDKVIGPITPTWENVTDKAAVGNTPPKEVKWAVNADTGVEAFFALEVPAGYLVIGTVTLGNTYLGFIWNTNTDASKPDGAVYTEETFKASALDVSTLFSPVKTGPGLEHVGSDDSSLKIKIKDGEKYLDVDTNGLYTKGIETAISTAVKEVSDSVDTLSETVTDLNNTVEQHATIIKQIQSDFETADLTAANKNIADIKRSVAFRQITFGKASGTIEVKHKDGIIRNIHCYYGTEEIEVLVERGSAKGMYENDSVTVSCNANGLTISEENPLIVTYEEVIYNRTNIDDDTTTNE